jgi:hypothetical protein
MSRILYYTITNFCPYADECIKLLYNSIKINNKNDFDFVVLANKNIENSKEFNITTIVDSHPLYDQYVGFLKYSDLIPKNYDTYIYLDSDILYFGQLEQLISENHEFTITKENHLMSHEWFSYQHIDRKNRKKFGSLNGINAGSFVFKNLDFLTSVKNLYNDHIRSTPVENAKLEQSSFNYALALLSDFNLEKYYDISPICELYCDVSPIEGKLLYHFCNFVKSMEFKYNNMKALYDNYTSS